MNIDYLIEELQDYKKEGITEVFIEVCDINDTYGGDTTFDISNTHREILDITVNLPNGFEIQVERI